jgi:hypothetical protein
VQLAQQMAGLKVEGEQAAAAPAAALEEDDWGDFS